MSNMDKIIAALLSLSLIFFLLRLWMHRRYSYWQRKNIAFIKPFPIFGNLKEILLSKRSAADHFTDLYNHPKAKDEPVVGTYFFFTPSLMVRDLELIKLILVRDFNKFSNRFAKADQKRDALGFNNLFLLKNPEWKELRSKLSPFFSSGKLKVMFPLIAEVGKQMEDYLASFKDDEVVENIRELSSAYTTDVIATVAFGVQANSLKNRNGDFRRHGRIITDITLLRAIELATIFFIPKLVPLTRSKQFSEVSSRFFRKAITYVIEKREKSGEVRNDLIDILIGFKNAKDFDGNTDFLVAQAAIFFSAGFHTSASAMSFTLYELAKNHEIQKRLRNEIKDALARNNGHITYEMLSEMEYLAMVLDETGRLYPPLGYLDRECVLPVGEKDYSLKPVCDYAIPNGMPVSIPFFAIQRDAKYFPDPLKYDPERFSAKNKPNIVPLSYMPFGAGPRFCIGERMAKIQTKIGLINVLKSHFVSTCDSTPKEIVFDKGSVLMQEEGDLNLKFIRDPLFPA